MRPRKRSRSEDTALNSDINRLYEFIKNVPRTYDQTITPTNPESFDLWDSGDDLKMYDGSVWRTITWEGQTTGAFVLRDGTLGMTGAWDAGAFRITTANLTIDALSNGVLQVGAGGAVTADATLTDLAAYDHTSLQNILGSGEYHLTQSEQEELTGWLDDVSLGVSGDLTLPTGVPLLITDKIRFNSSGGPGYIEWYDGSSTWDVNIYRSGGGRLKTDDVFEAVGDIYNDSGILYGKSGTAIRLDLGSAAATQIRIENTTANARISLALKSGSTGVQIVSFDEDEASPDVIAFARHAGNNVSFFENAVSGRDPTLRIYGYNASGALKYGQHQITWRAGDSKNVYYITAEDGEIDFDDDNLLTTGTLGAGTSTLGATTVDSLVVDALTIDANKILAGSGASGIITLGGTGGSNNEDLTFDFETTADKVIVGTGSGVTNWDFGSLDLATSGDITLSSTGVVKGSTMMIMFAAPINNQTADKWLRAGGVVLTSDKGVVMPDAGSILAITAYTNIDSYTPVATINARTLVNNSEKLTSTKTLDATGHITWYGSAARGTHTFTAGQKLQVHWDITGTLQYDTPIVGVKIVLDA